MAQEISSVTWHETLLLIAALVKLFPSLKKQTVAMVFLEGHGVYFAPIRTIAAGGAYADTQRQMNVEKGNGMRK